jgi:hypothetical protein
MALNKTQVCNRALQRIGVPTVTDVDTQDGNVPKALRAAWDMARLTLLREHRWNWAKKRATLARLTDAPDHGFDYYYALPADYIKLDRLNKVAIGQGGTDIFSVELHDNQLVLATDESSAQITYVSDPGEGAGLQDPSFCEALSLIIAADIASTVVGDRGLRSQMVEEYERFSRSRAMAQDARESKPDGGKLEGAIRGSLAIQARYASLRPYYSTSLDLYSE